MRQYILLMLLSFAVLTAHIEAQDYQISFAGRGASSTVESVEVQNLTQNTSITLTEGQILHLKGVATSVNDYIMDNNNMIIYPNPITDIGYVEFTSEYSEKYIFSLYDLMGRKVLLNSFFLEKGNHQFVISGLKQGTYLLNLHSSNYSKSGKIICLSLAGGREQISYVGQSTKKMKTVKLKGSTSDNLIEMQYNEGDRLLFTASSGDYRTVKTTIPTSSSIETFYFVECNDADGNNYKVVKLGNQLWMAENLFTTKFADGSNIPLITDDIEWGELGDNNTDKAYCNVSPGYGLLYTYAAATNGNNRGINVKGICPNSWKLPSDADWSILENYLADNGYNYDGSIGGGGSKVGKALASCASWLISNDNGDVGYNSMTNNSSGFSATAGRFRYSSNGAGRFYDEKINGLWWSSTQTNITRANYRIIRYSHSDLYKDDIYKSYGLSVRCVKDFNEYINVSSPTNGDKWGIGTEKTITWDTNISSDVRIELWNSTNLETIIASSIYNINEYSWDIPSSLSIGDEYKIRITSNYDESVYGESENYFSIVEVNTGSIIDIEGNEYKTVKIGEQWWMAENLRTTQLNDGKQITESNINEWNSFDVPCFITNNKEHYYNVYTVETDKVCPTGWYVPTEDDWKKLSSSVDYKPKNLASQSGWEASEQVNSPGNEQILNNNSGFNGFSQGIYAYNSYEGGHFSLISQIAQWWSSTVYSEHYYKFSLSYSSPLANLSQSSSNDYGYNIRCVKNTPPISEFAVSDTEIIEGFSVSFVNESQGRGNSWLWDFGDGTTSSDENPSHIYTTHGKFTVSLTTTNDAGNNTITKQELIHVLENFTGDTGTLTDIEDNSYKWIGIGTQIWMAEDLRTTKLNDGTNLTLVTGSVSDAELKNPLYGWQWNDKNTSVEKGYGAIYNWYTVETGKVCPSGWHVPTDSEWNVLRDYISLDKGYDPYSNMGIALKSLLGWETEGNGANEYGFNALPTGSYIFKDGRFLNAGKYCFWWTSTADVVDYQAIIRYVGYDVDYLWYGGNKKEYGMSIRCIKD